MRRKQKPKPEPDAPKTASIKAMPSTARWKSLREQAVSTLQCLQNEMQSYFDDRSQEWQEGERGETFQEKIEAVEEAISNAQDIEI